MRWVEEIEPNLAFGTQSSRGFVSDMWPRGQHLSQGDVDAFLELARGWHRYPDNPDAINLAIRRLAGSLSRPGGRFGQEDRILDIAIAFEVLYGGKTGHKLAQRAAALLGVCAAEQKRAYDEARSFYNVRSKKAHWKKSPPSREVLDRELEAGRGLACLTIESLLNRDPPLLWAEVMRSLLPKTKTYIDCLWHCRQSAAEGYGLLRVMDEDDHPRPRDIAIYETLPNELPRVAGIVSTVQQTPLSHVNLRAVQDGVPNAYIRNAVQENDIASLIGSHVHYIVTEDGYTIRAATRVEVDAHYAASRPATAQTPERDLARRGAATRLYALPTTTRTCHSASRKATAGRCWLPVSLAACSRTRGGPVARQPDRLSPGGPSIRLPLGPN